MSVAQKILAKLNRMQRGTPFSINSFYELGSETSVQKTFSRMVQQGLVARLSKGFYARPKPLPSLPSIKVTASANEVARVWAKQHGYKLVSQGLESAYRLGFQTQAPMKTVFWSNGPSREFKIGNQIVEVRHTSERKLRWENKPEGALLRGLLVTPPQSVGVPALKKAVQRLSLNPTQVKIITRKLSSLPQLSEWKNKLQQLE